MQTQEASTNKRLRVTLGPTIRVQAACLNRRPTGFEVPPQFPYALLDIAH